MASASTVTSSNLGTDRDTSGGNNNNNNNNNSNKNNVITNDPRNWRIIPSAAIDYQPYLDNRHEWSNEQLQDSLKLYHAFLSCTDSYVAPGIQDALNSIDHAYRLYGPESVICSFNGGKDAVVILHLIRAAHARYYDTAIKAAAQKKKEQQQQQQQQQQSTNSGSTDNNNNPDDDSISIPIYRPRMIYFEHAEEFPQVLQFLQDSVHDYDLDMMVFEQGVGFSDGLKILVEHNYLNDATKYLSRPFPLAFCLGTRTSDPNAAGQDVFAPSSHYMPPFMRVNPILNWTYGHVWHFLRLFQLPYCSLYDEGYTSLGSTSDTLPCPALQVVSSSTNNNNNNSATTRTNGNSPSSHLPKFWPAYMLKDWDQERAGRIKKEKKSSGITNTTTTTATATASLLSPTVSTASTKMGATTPRRNKKATIPRVESYLSTVSDLRKSDPTPLLEVDTTQVSLGTGTSVAGSFENTASGTTTTNNNNKRSQEDEDEDEEEGTIFTLDSLPEAYDSDDDDSDQQQQQPRQRSLQQSPKTVGILIIGDEILKGMTLDVNTNVAAKALRKENVLLQRVVVCSDDQDEIVKDIQRMLEEDKVDVLITSGGIGPTHDDVTVKSVAAALNRELILNKEMVQLLWSKMDRNTTTSTTTPGDGDDTSVPDDYTLTDAQVKMATLPSNAKLRYFSEDNDWPVLQCRNIFILPGVPQFFADKIEGIATYLSSSQFERSVFYKIVLSVDEASIVDVLNRVVSKHPGVSFGSYPFVSHPEFKTVVTLEASYQQQPLLPSMLLNRNGTTPSSRDTSGKGIPSTAVTGTGSFVIATSSKEQRDRQVRLALDDLITQLPKGSILRVENDDLTTFT
jgi:molybdopterin-biosynthesis enzyme MoeA-like protein/3'-phosphoadenosine 5'-phosphosulfate sulfotransferase (PAPS reductase)/FAD synthetase